MKVNTPKQKAVNVRIASDNGCVICGRQYECDPAHFPEHRGMGGSKIVGWGLLEFLPLCRREHRLLDAGDPVTFSLVEELSKRYYGRMYEAYKDDKSIYLGPEDVVERVRREEWLT